VFLRPRGCREAEAWVGERALQILRARPAMWPPACGAVPPYATSAKRSARDEVAGVQDQLRAERRFGQRFFQKRVALVGAAVDDENDRDPEARRDGLVDPVASMSLISVLVRNGSIEP
jgi:hypothetical protein